MFHDVEKEIDIVIEDYGKVQMGDVTLSVYDDVNNQKVYEIYRDYRPTCDDVNAKPLTYNLNILDHNYIDHFCQFMNKFKNRKHLNDQQQIDYLKSEIKNMTELHVLPRDNTVDKPKSLYNFDTTKTKNLSNDEKKKLILNDPNKNKFLTNTKKLLEWMDKNFTIIIDNELCTKVIARENGIMVDREMYILTNPNAVKFIIVQLLEYNYDENLRYHLIRRYILDYCIDKQLNNCLNLVMECLEKQAFSIIIYDNDTDIKENVTIVFNIKNVATINFKFKQMITYQSLIDLKASIYDYITHYPSNIYWWLTSYIDDYRRRKLN